MAGPSQELVDAVSSATLRQLGDFSIDDVLAAGERGLEGLPSYAELYRRWERQLWTVSSLDFTPDREAWRTAQQLERDATMWTHRLFFHGEERVTSTLAPFVWAAPAPDVAIFLSTQLADEARHTAFFERWWREVVGCEAVELRELLEEVRPDVNEGYRTLFFDRLPGAAARLASHPDDVDAFVEGVTIYHLVAEGTLALTGQRFQLASMRELGQSHFGFYQGFTAVARDESRHVTFGVKVLQDAVREDAARFGPLIRDTVAQCLPLIAGVVEPPDPSYLLDGVASPSEVIDFALASLRKRLRAIGLDLD